MTSGPGDAVGARSSRVARSPSSSLPGARRVVASAHRASPSPALTFRRHALVVTSRIFIHAFVPTNRQRRFERARGDVPAPGRRRGVRCGVSCSLRASVVEPFLVSAPRVFPSSVLAPRDVARDASADRPSAPSSPFSASRQSGSEGLTRAPRRERRRSR